MRRDLVFLILSVALVGLYVLVADGGFPLDDSWIHQVYGRNLAENGEWAFVPGEPSAASTSPLYTVLLALGYLLNVDYQLWTHGLGALALAAAGMLGARLTERLLPGRAYAGWLGGLAQIFAWHLLWAAASGMETMLFATFTLLLIYLAWQAVDGLGGAWRAVSLRQDVLYGGIFGAVAALAMTARPEGVLLAGLCGVAVLLRWPDASRRVLAWSAGAGIGFALFIAPYLALNLSLAGSILPNTADAKFVQHEPLLALPYTDRLWRMFVPVMAGTQVMFIPGVVYFGWWVLRAFGYDGDEDHGVRLHKLADLLPLLWFIAIIALYAARLPAAYQHGRYVIPGLPALIVVGVVGTYQLVIIGRRSMLGRVFSRTLAIAAAASFVYFGLVIGPDVYDKDVRIIDEEMVANAYWIRDNLPPDELLAIHDIGAVGYFAPREIVDIAGLVTPEVTAYIGDKAALWDFMQREGAVYLMAFSDQVPGGDTSDPRLCFLHQSDGNLAPSAGGSKMVIYRLTYDGLCPP